MKRLAPTLLVVLLLLTACDTLIAPEPTLTPGPTETPFPTAVPQPIELTGTGQSTQEFTLTYAPARVELLHQGDNNFTVNVVGSDGDITALVNVIGFYDGEAPLTEPDTYFLQVTADGPWNVRIEPTRINDDLANGARGSTGFVSARFNAPAASGMYTFNHAGDGYFGVQLLCGSDPVGAFIQNQSGFIENEQVEVTFTEGALCYWVVDAQSQWSIEAN